MKRNVGAFVLALGLSSPAFAGEKKDHTGFNMAFNLGFQNVRGNYFENDIKPGPAFKLDLGWRIMRHFSLETGIASGSGESKVLEETVTFLHILNLDARYFPLGAGRFEPNVLAGWTLGSRASAPVEVAPNTNLTFTGYSPTLGAGTRLHVSDLLYVQGDFRYLYTRFTEQNGNSLPKQAHGDAFMVLFGAGLQF